MLLIYADGGRDDEALARRRGRLAKGRQTLTAPDGPLRPTYEVFDMAVAKHARSGRKSARRTGNPPQTPRGSENRAPDESRLKSHATKHQAPLAAAPAKETGIRQDSEHRDPFSSPSDGSLAIHVSRAALHDITRRLEVAIATAAACRAGLMAPSADAETNADIVLALRWSVIDVIQRQIARLRMIAGAAVKKGMVVAVVKP